MGQITRKTFHTQLSELQEDVLRMGALAEDAIRHAVDALKCRDSDLARRVIADDDQIDALELEIEARCLRLLALQQPLAGDLRTVGTSLKLITDLERMADHATDIARVVLRIEGQQLIKPLVDVPRMADIAREMVRRALTAYVRRDVDMAEETARMDEDIDHLFSQVFRELLTYMMEAPATISQATHLMFVASYLERIADHATNLCEWVVFLVGGVRRGLND